MKTLYFDVVSGASGDMILSSLIDLGVPLSYLQEQFAKFSIPGFSIATKRVMRSNIAATHLELSWDTPRQYRHIDQILGMIQSAGFPPRVFDRCKQVLMRIGAAEAKVHDMPIEKVHFHEIGAIDTIIDVSGICLALEYLGIDNIEFSSLMDGSGTVKTEHGTMPIPVPAVAEMMQGFAMRILDVQSELLTPTGCAVLTALGSQVASGPNGKVLKTGYGCGTKVFENLPNILRAFLVEGKAGEVRDAVSVIETDMDHISGEIMGDVSARLIKQGALDVSYSPIFMKKGRPGYRLTVLCKKETVKEYVDTIMLHTRTLGVRIHDANRIIANRSASTTTLRGEPINEKVCSYGNSAFTKPEYESLAALSEKTGVPIIELFEEYLRSKK
jgi:pyridinium-3,5-bisthiocarboxylic acid mononucleotide nickel chelatase